jgi:hypothetical protein
MVGCLIRLALLPLCIVVSYLLLSLRAPFPSLELFAEGAEVAAILAGIFFWFALISWLDMRAMSSQIALASDWRLTDGEPAVIGGRVEAKGELLEAPFSGQRCIGYWYEVSHYTHHANMNRVHWTDYEGFAMAPASVRGPLRSLDILAEPDRELFHEVPEREITADEDWARAEEYVRATDFGELPPGPLADTRKRSRHDGPCDFREDKQVDEPTRDLRERKPPEGSARQMEGHLTLKEKIVREGDEVLIAGVYSAENEGIAPDPDPIMRPFHIVVGGAAALRKKMKNRVVGIVITLGLAIVTAAAYLLYFAP